MVANECCEVTTAVTTILSVPTPNSLQARPFVQCFHSGQMLFLQSIMVAARSFGLDTCPQAALCSRHEILQKRLGIPPEQMVVCGMALGYADPDAIVNTFITERMALEEFVTFVEEVKGD